MQRASLARTVPALALGGLALATLVGATARWFWVGELVVSLAWHLGLLSFAVAGLCLGAKRLVLAAAALALGLLHAGPELALYAPRTPEPLRAGETGLVVATCNLLWGNRDLASFPRWLAEHRPDVVLVQELSPARLATLDELAGYPHRFVSPAAERWTSSTWGTAILSRLPFESARELPTACGRAPIEAVVRVGGRRVTVRGAHPNRPGRPWRLAQRNAVLDALARASWAGTCVLAGDLNATSTSPAFRRLARSGDLADTRAGFGRQPTFVLRGPLVRGFGLPLAIDHVLVSPDVRVLGRETLELPGSDHRAVLARLAVPTSVQ